MTHPVFRLVFTTFLVAQAPDTWTGSGARCPKLTYLCGGVLTQKALQCN
jgi:hypothetical protein